MNYLSKNTVRSTWTFGLALVALMITSLSGCKKRPSPLGDGLGLGGGRVCESYIKSAEAYGEALSAYLEAPTVANCETLKGAGDNLFETAKTCSLITPEQRKEAEESWNEWKDLDCEGLVEGSN